MFLSKPIEPLNENDILNAMKTTFEYDLDLLKYNLTSSSELPALGKKLLSIIEVKVKSMNAITIKTINETDVVKVKLTDIIENGHTVKVKYLSKIANAGPTTDINHTSKIYPSYLKMIKSCKEHRIDVGFYEDFEKMKDRNSTFAEIYRSNIFNSNKGATDKNNKYWSVSEINNKKLSYSGYRDKCKKAFTIKGISILEKEIDNKYDLEIISSSRIYTDFSNITSFIKLIKDCITSICEKPKMNVNKLPQGTGPLSFAQRYITDIFLIFNNMLDDVLFMYFKKLESISNLNKENLKDNTI